MQTRFTPSKMRENGTAAGFEPASSAYGADALNIMRRVGTEHHDGWLQSSRVSHADLGIVSGVSAGFCDQNGAPLAHFAHEKLHLGAVQIPTANAWKKPNCWAFFHFCFSTQRISRIRPATLRTDIFLISKNVVPEYRPNSLGKVAQNYCLLVSGVWKLFKFPDWWTKMQRDRTSFSKLTILSKLQGSVKRPPFLLWLVAMKLRAKTRKSLLALRQISKLLTNYSGKGSSLWEHYLVPTKFHDDVSYGVNVSIYCQ